MDPIAPSGPPDEPGPPSLSLGVRLLLLIGGGLLLLIGIAGLALPGIQGILTIALAVAVLSVASARAHRLMRRLLARWPGLLKRIDGFRDKVHQRLGRRD